MVRRVYVRTGLPLTALAALVVSAGPSAAHGGGHGGGGHGRGFHGGIATTATYSGVHHGGMHYGSMSSGFHGVGNTATYRGMNHGGTHPGVIHYGTMSSGPFRGVGNTATYRNVTHSPSFTFPRGTYSNFGRNYNYNYGRNSFNSGRGYYPGRAYGFGYYPGFYGGYYPGAYGFGFFPGYYGGLGYGGFGGGFGGLMSLAMLSGGYGGLGYGGFGGYGGYGPGGYGNSGVSYSTPSVGTYGGPFVANTPSTAAPPPATDASTLTIGDVVIRVHVPPTATVWINGARTTQAGELREFMSSDLAPGRTYTYTVRAKWSDGQFDFDQTRKVKVQGGEVRMVDFAAPPNE
jgi:uncharacterized protein (TIGR03000 family)